MLLSACAGQSYVPPGEVWRVLRGHGGPYDLVVGELRVPRIVLGALVGAALGLSGALVGGRHRRGAGARTPTATAKRPPRSGCWGWTPTPPPRSGRACSGCGSG
ncbi:iron chelate uptake ABC transporter family permease subunit [Streptomyces sp. NPDC058466]|uniref:iron chelate uptake ABC transporter family permease subunit n=1 Tax=Streptomyces sp. NPDC058466 TaxID=3346512 RepID=UPI00365E68CD